MKHQISIKGAEAKKEASKPSEKSTAEKGQKVKPIITTTNSGLQGNRKGTQMRRLFYCIKISGPLK